ncbi:PPC domain-containing DNA-binding protein [Crenobacter caeni]|uniref:DUF296 domain-containing protein n=1 Tax=Crenobacter caeni TaxID=2705474 RepID=A0A6B2KU00_9NEIS|nr:DUF296 domain-containing protein [Crenobacter caeni]NDV13503.1 DUF296 domain-containing protein [Crenobacter caeni]
MHSARFVVVRLLPGEELLSALASRLAGQGVAAGWIAGVVGSLSVAALRFAGRPDTTCLCNVFEIVSLCGTLDAGGGHLHMTVADAQGAVLGGHVMPGSVVRTTCELVIGVLEGVAFGREPCPLSGYDELVVLPQPDRKDSAQ